MILDSQRKEAGAWRAEVPETWLQGRSVYGGLQAALALRAMRSVLALPVPLRVMQLAFIAPVPAGTVRVVPRLIRAGKSVTHIEARILDGENTAALAVGIFGATRRSRIHVAPPRPPYEQEQAFDVKYVEGLLPAFLQHMSLRWLGGAIPFSGNSKRRALLQVSLPDEGRATEEHVLALADAPPPIALSFINEHAAGSSMTWTLEMLTDSVSELPLRDYFLDTELVAGRDGYTSQSVTVWAPNGEPVALSRQSMVVFG